MRWDSEIHLNMAMKLQSLIRDIYKSLFFRVCNNSLPLAFPPSKGSSSGQRHLCTAYTVFLCSRLCFVWFPRPHLQRGHFFPYMPLSAVGCQDFSYLQNSSFFGATRLRVLPKGKGKASSCLEWGQLSRKWPKMRQKHSVSLFTWE